MVMNAFMNVSMSVKVREKKRPGTENRLDGKSLGHRERELVEVVALIFVLFSLSWADRVGDSSVFLGHHRLSSA